MTSGAASKAVHAGAALRLFCDPYAGGGASLYRPWTALLQSAIQVCPVQLPGRVERFREQPHTTLHGAVNELAAGVMPLVDRPFALFGHSMGASIAFELARELRRRGASPAWLFVGGSRAPQRPAPAGCLSALPEQVFVDAVQRKYGGIPAAILQTPELLQLLLPVLRADLTMIETYRYRDEPPLECPITVFGGLDDDTVTPDELRAWQEQTVGPFEYTTLPGGHFFVKESRAALVRGVEERLRSVIRTDVPRARQD
jgi:medium-chain acyl-[acyl-carrier-protein] hydrolase